MSDCGKTSPPSSGSGNTPVGAATTSCKTCAITSETVTTARADRSRKRIGIAERVKLIASPAGSYTWSVSGGGTLNSTSGSTVTFTAGDRTSTSTITASQGSCTCNIVFTIVEPNGAYQVQFGSTTHTQGTASVPIK